MIHVEQEVHAWVVILCYITYSLIPNTYWRAGWRSLHGGNNFLPFMYSSLQHLELLRSLAPVVLNVVIDPPVQKFCDRGPFIPHQHMYYYHTRLLFRCELSLLIDVDLTIGLISNKYTYIEPTTTI